MPVHRVLVETEQQVYAVAVGEHLFIANAQRQQDVSSADDRLIGVVRIEVQTTPAEHASEDVARRRNSLAGGPPDGDGEIETVRAHGFSLNDFGAHVRRSTIWLRKRAPRPTGRYQLEGGAPQPAQR